MQTRAYTAVTDTEILAASTAVLQDMGYAIDEIEEPLGVLTASKRAEAGNRFEAFGKLALDGVKCLATLGLGCTGNQYGKSDDTQDIRLTVISRPQLENRDNVIVRVTMQRVIWDKRGRLAEQQTIVDEAVYAAFFHKMSRAVFLEQQGA